ncbi:MULTISPECIES: tetratricopeptide repeat protein [unclassified Leeuwenhoekiella]|uniref:tetratricopeptide repeat protein n=1 Tax=unclassified Leeuwenhoekiella TaxID=2615029 RepID=UPI000C610D93|nr:MULTISPECIES: tetratricopeptide repeat protein [unclassified Leeuwenhoekiella]MBA80513.1 hypothetical protein [Leeuwenhoekiella sp.]
MNREELVEAYFAGRLSEDEARQLSDALQRDAAFAEEFEVEKDLQAALIDQSKADLKSTLVNLETEKFNKNQKSTGLKLWRYAVAAILIIGLSLFGALFIGNQSTPEELYAENFEPYRNIIAPVVRGEHAEGLLEKSFALYERGDYDQAEKDFSKLYEATGDGYLLFYRGNALLALGRTEEAITLFKSHQETRDNFYYKSRWYLALAYLKLDKKADAISILEEIVANNSYNAEKAAQLLKELD